MENVLVTQNGAEFQNPILPPPITISCMEGVIAAYDDYTNGTFITPAGYNAVARFTGWDAYFGFSQKKRNLE